VDETVDSLEVGELGAVTGLPGVELLAGTTVVKIVFLTVDVMVDSPVLSGTGAVTKGIDVGPVTIGIDCAELGAVGLKKVLPLRVVKESEMDGTGWV
jgi:hypothetical protein